MRVCVCAGQLVGDSSVRLGRVSAESERHPAALGLSGAHLRPRGAAAGGGALQTRRRRLQVWDPELFLSITSTFKSNAEPQSSVFNT